MVTVAVDANGADLGPAEVAAGAALAAARGIRVQPLRTRRRAGRSPAEGVEVVDAPVSIAKAPDPAHAARRTPDASIVQAAKAVGAGEADALVSGGSTGSALAAGLFHLKRAKGIYRPALALPRARSPARPVLLLDVGANAEVRPEHLVQFAFMGAAFAEAVLGIARPARGAALQRRGARQGHARRRRRPRDARRPAGPAPELRRQRRGHDAHRGAADVVVTDGFTGNVALKILEGASGQIVQAVRCRAMPRPPGRKLGGLLLRPALRALRDELDPETPGGAYMLGLRRVGVVAHGRFTRRGFARAIEVAARAVDERVVTERTHGGARGRGRRCGAPSESRGYGSRRHDPRRGPHAHPRHLADELEIDPGRIQEETRFKEDLEADSLDLYTLVQELEDSYGVRMSDEQAARILTVGQAVDFVWPPAPPTPDPEARR